MKVKITKRAVEAIAPQAKDLVLFDTELIGFLCKITPTGKRVYFAEARVAGRKTRVTIGQHGHVTPDQARAEAQKLLARMAVGENPARERAVAKKTPTLADLATRYLEQHAATKKKATSASMDEIMLRVHILPALGRVKVNAITRDQIARLHHSLRATPYMANRVWALLSVMLNLAEKWGLRPDGSNPCRHVERFKEQPRQRYLTGEELSRLGATLAEAEALGTESPFNIAAIKLLLLTGCRRNEILTMTWAMVDYERACLRLPDSKTGARVVQLNSPALEVLARIPRIEGNPFVIVGDRSGAHLVCLKNPWKRIKTRAGLDDVRLHDLRHSHAAMGVSAGLGLPIIGKLLGHVEVETTAKYAHVADDPQRAASEEIGRRIAEAMAKPVPPAKVVNLPVKGTK